MVLPPANYFEDTKAMRLSTSSSINKALARLSKALRHRSRFTLIDEINLIGYEIKAGQYPGIVLTKDMENYRFHKTRHHPLPILDADSNHQIVLNFLVALYKISIKKKTRNKKSSVVPFTTMTDHDLFRRNELGQIRQQIGGIIHRNCCIEETFSTEDFLLQELVLESYWKLLASQETKTKAHYMGGTFRVINSPPDFKMSSALEHIPHNGFKSTDVPDILLLEEYKQRSNIIVESTSVELQQHSNDVKNVIAVTLLDDTNIQSEIIDISNLVEIKNIPFKDLFLTKVEEVKTNDNQIISSAYRFLIHGYK